MKALVEYICPHCNLTVKAIEGAKVTCPHPNQPRSKVDQMTPKPSGPA